MKYPMIGHGEITEIMRIFITGGTGFIGSALVKLLIQRGHTLLILTGHNITGKKESGQIKYVEGNLHDLDNLERVIKEFEPYFVIHLAWEGLPEYSMELCKKNLEYGINLFTASVKAGCINILSTGSCWEYTEKQGCLSEDGKLDTSSVFPAVKNALQFYGEAVTRENKGKFYWLRLFYVYGPGQRKSSLIPHIIDSLQGGELKCRNPQNRNDFIYIYDVVRAITEVIEKRPEGTVYNVGSGYSTEVLEVIRQIFESEGKHFDTDRLSNVSSSTMKNENKVDFWADINRISKDTGWKPEYSLKSGIETTLSNYLMEVI